MIIHKHKALFFHIPKTGGTSIEASLGWKFRQKKIDTTESFVRWKLPKIKHWMPYKVRNLVGEDVWEESYKFSFVRNPWDRIVSFFHWDRDHRKFCHLCTPFSEYAFDFIDGKRTHHLSCIEWLGDVNLDFIGRFENMQEDYNYVCDQIGAEKKELPHIHQSRRRHYSYYYDDNLRDLVAEKWKKDIEIFGYEYEDVSGHLRENRR